MKQMGLFNITSKNLKSNLILYPIRVYQHVNYGGQSGYFTKSGTFIGFIGYCQNMFKSNDISSLKITPGWGVTLYAADGQKLDFNNTGSTYMNIPSLVDHGFNDKTIRINIHKAEGFAPGYAEHFDYDFGKCQNKIIYAILAIMVVILIWLFIKVYWKPKHQSMNFAPNVAGRW